MLRSSIVFSEDSRHALHILKRPYETHRFVETAAIKSAAPNGSRVLFRVDKNALVIQHPEPIGARALGEIEVERISLNQPIFVPGSGCHEFRLRCNIVKQTPRSNKRAPVFDVQEIFAYLARHFEGGAELLTIDRPRFSAKQGKVEVFHCIDVTGVVRVTDGEALRAVVERGVGRSRAFGCGLIVLDGGGA